MAVAAVAAFVPATATAAPAEALTVSGRALADGRPAADVRVELGPLEEPGGNLWLAPEEGGGGSGTRTVFDGGFRFAGLAPGRYRLEVRPDPRIPAASRVVDVFGDEHVQLDLSAAAVSGSVLAAAGASTTGLSAVLTAADGGRQSASVDPAGRFLLTPLAAGSYLLTIEREGVTLASQPLEAGALDIQGLVLVVE